MAKGGNDRDGCEERESANRWFHFSLRSCCFAWRFFATSKLNSDVPGLGPTNLGDVALLQEQDSITEVAGSQRCDWQIDMRSLGCVGETPPRQRAGRRRYKKMPRLLTGAVAEHSSLEQGPEELVVDLVVELDFLGFDKSSGG